MNNQELRKIQGYDDVKDYLMLTLEKMDRATIQYYWFRDLLQEIYDEEGGIVGWIEKGEKKDESYNS